MPIDSGIAAGHLATFHPHPFIQGRNSDGSTLMAQH